MAERRMFRRDIFESSVMHCLSQDNPEFELEAQRIFEALILMADDHGRGRMIPQAIRIKAFGSAQNAYQRADCDKVKDWIHQIEKQGAIAIYEVDGQKYYCLTSWEKYQTGKWHKRKSLLPGPPEISGKLSKNFRGNAAKEKLNKKKIIKDNGLDSDEIDRKPLVEICRELVPRKCGNPKELNNQVDALEKLIRLDRGKIDIDGNYSQEKWQEEVFAVLRWARADCEPRPNGFCWSANFQSIPRLRDRSSKGDVTKYEKMREHYLVENRLGPYAGKKKDDPEKFKAPGKTKL